MTANTMDFTTSPIPHTTVHGAGRNILLVDSVLVPLVENEIEVTTTTSPLLACEMTIFRMVMFGNRLRLKWGLNTSQPCNCNKMKGLFSI